MTTPLVWLPHAFEDLDGLPGDLRYEFVSALDPIPESIADVAFYVPWYGMASGIDGTFAAMRNLEVVQILSAGVNHIRPHLPEGVKLCNGREIHTASTAELAVTLALASLRRIPAFVRRQERHEYVDEWATSMADRTVLIVGYGSIGAAIEARLLPFETTVVNVARSAREGVHGFEELPDLLSRADVVIMIVPLTDQTRQMVDERFLGAMKDGALLVNVARGAVVDQDALIAACRSGRITAALDVMEPEPLPAEHPLWDTPGVLITPHVGGHTTAYMPRARRLVREQLTRFAAGQPLVNVVTGEY